MRKRMRKTAVGLLAVLAVSGCTSVRQDPKCKWALPVIGGGLGALGGGLGTSEIESGGGEASNAEIAGGAAAGLVVGSLLGLVAAHFLCEEAPPPAPPPPPPAPPARGTKIAEIPGANFEFNKANLTAEGKAKLSEAVAILKQHPTLRVAVEGHTDSVGGEAYNMRLSERRAQSAADYLAESGISRSRLDVKGFGKTRPVADNSTAAGRARNRRVEIIAE